MASLPPQRSSQRRASPSTQQRQHQQQRDSTEDSYASTQRESNGPGSLATSVDSQTVLLNQASSASASTSSSTFPDAKQTDGSTSTSKDQKQAADISSEEPRKCWICFNDETEDPPDASPWRRPCPCALTAHEACLLDWIADLESPSATRSTVRPADLKCPQCKSEIKLARPRSYVVDAVGTLARLANKMILPAVVGGVGYTMLLGCSAHGAHSIRMIFGAADAEAILAPLEEWEWSWVEVQAQQYVPTMAGLVFRGWRGLRVELGLPLIPLTLIASRTTLADAILPVLPIVFFATHTPSYRTLELGHWPPSAALTLVLLPYIRSAYDEYIARVWAARERGWLDEVRPRLGQDQQQTGNEQADAANDVQDGNADGIELGIEVEILEEEEEEVDDGSEDSEDDDNERQPQANGVATPLHAPPRDGNNEGGNRINIAEELAAAARQEQQQQQRRQNQHDHHARPRDTDLLPYISRATDSIIGALLFPTLASLSGEILKLLLPRSWTTQPHLLLSTYGSGSTRWGRGFAPGGFLQTKWGRSIIGGCLLVVLKDAVRIYCRWRIAVSFRSRRVVDCDRTNIGKASSSTSTSNTGNTSDRGSGGGNILAGQAVNIDANEDNAGAERRPGGAFSFIMHNR